MLNEFQGHHPSQGEGQIRYYVPSLLQILLIRSTNNVDFQELAWAEQIIS